MAKKVFTVTQAPGSKRSSDRDYTHAIIAKFDRERFERELPQRIAGCDNATSRSNFKWYTENANGTVGELWGAGSKKQWPRTQQMIDEGKAHLAKYGDTYEKYVAYLQEEERQRTANRLAKEDGEFFVLQWSMSAANAAKGLGQWLKPVYMHKDVQIVETTRTK